MSTPKAPLLPNYSNMKARIAEHNAQMEWSAKFYRTTAICPDCYAPIPRCVHDNPYDRRNQ